MGNKEYRLEFLPMFQEDLHRIMDYISLELQNPMAAEHLLTDIQDAILQRLPFAESFEPYRSSRSRKHPYYRISVKNYTIFYVVIGNIMEVRRILYSRSDWEKLM